MFLVKVLQSLQRVNPPRSASSSINRKTRSTGARRCSIRNASGRRWRTRVSISIRRRSARSITRCRAPRSACANASPRSSTASSPSAEPPASHRRGSLFSRSRRQSPRASLSPIPISYFPSPISPSLPRPCLGWWPRRRPPIALRQSERISEPARRAHATK